MMNFFIELTHSPIAKVMIKSMSTQAVVVQDFIMTVVVNEVFFSKLVKMDLVKSGEKNTEFCM